MKTKKNLFIFSLFISLFCFSIVNAHLSELTLSAEDDQKIATIRVLLDNESEGVLLEAHGAFEVINPATGKKISSGRKGKRYRLHPHADGIKWGEDFLGIFQIQIIPTNSETTFLIDGIQYRGAIEAYHIDGKLSLINEIDVESYLKSTLGQKIAHSYPDTVLDAVAIIARTDAYYYALFNHDAFWHIEASAVGYHGIGLNYQNLAIERAIDSTRYLIMTFEDQPFPATWTENCGGKTAPYQIIFRKNTPTPQGVSSVFAAKDRSDTRWILTLDTQDLAKVAKTNRITGIDLFVDHFSNKVYAVRIHDGVHTEDVDILALQEHLGIDKLKSNDFNVSLKGNIATIEGHGRGLGTGLCLFSAKQMAERGDAPPRILAEFFPYTHIEKMHAYPEAIVSASKGSFISPKQKKASEKKHRLLH